MLAACRRRMPERSLDVLHARGVRAALLTGNPCRSARNTVVHTLYVWNFSYSPFNSVAAAASRLHPIAASLHPHRGDAARRQFEDMEGVTATLDEVLSLEN